MNNATDMQGSAIQQVEAEKALEITNLHAWYGESHVLHGISLVVNKGEVVTLLGRNGAGRTTTLRAIPRAVSVATAVV
jgi:ABC-type branched-subunit amino acid transport system ATPase component